MDKICEIQTLAYSRDNAHEILNKLFVENLISDARVSDVDIAVKNTFDAGGISVLKRCEITMRTTEDLVDRVIELSNAANQVLDPETTVTVFSDTSKGYAQFVEEHVVPAKDADRDTSA